MSVSKWRWTEDCDHGICIGDCDKCDKAVFEEGEDDEIKEHSYRDRIHIVSDMRKRLG